MYFKYIKRFHKPFFDIDLNNLPPHRDVIDWIFDSNIEILNVAGNSSRSFDRAEEIYNIVMTYMIKVLSGNVTFV